MRSELPTPRRSYGSKRSPWTLWIVLGGTLAVGAVLLVTMRAMFQVGEDMVRSVHESRLPQGRRSVRTAESRLNELERAPEASPEARATVEGERIHGRVVFPPGMPESEVAWVVLTVPATTERPALVERAHVRADGVFAFESSELRDAAVLEIDAPHLYLAGETVVERAEARRPIELHPRLGAHVRGRVVLGEGDAELSRWLVGSRIVLGTSHVTWWSSTRERATLTRELTFELRGIKPSDDARELVAHTPFLREMRLEPDSLRPGASPIVELTATRGLCIDGRVVDSAGRPVARAELAFDDFELKAWNVGLGRDTTDDDGRFALIGMSSGVLVRARKEGYVAAAAVPVFGPDDRAELVLALGDTSVIRGRVRWSDGSAASGATVAADPELGGTTEMLVALADEDGRFELVTPAGGQFTLTARAFEPDDVDEQDHVVPGRRGVAFARSVASSKDEVVLELGAGHALRGRVSDEAGAPRPAFSVRAAPVRNGEALWFPTREVQGSFRGDEGRFELAGLHPGAWEVRAEFGSFASPRQRVEVREGGGAVELVLDGRPILAGVVRDDHGAPVAGAQVWLDELEGGTRNVRNWMAGRTHTDAEGRFRFEHLDAGLYVLQARSRELCARPLRFDAATAVRGRELELVLFDASDVELAVVDETGAPVPKAVATFVPEFEGGAGLYARELELGDHGRAGLGHVPPARYTLVASAPGFVESKRELELPTAAPGVVRVELRRGARLTLACTSKVEERSDAKLELFDASHALVASWEWDADAPGPGRLFGVTVVPGTYRVEAHDEAGFELDREVVVPNLEPVTVELEFER